MRKNPGGMFEAYLQKYNPAKWSIICDTFDKHNPKCLQTRLVPTVVLSTIVKVVVSNKAIMLPELHWRRQKWQ